MFRTARLKPATALWVLTLVITALLTAYAAWLFYGTPHPGGSGSTVTSSITTITTPVTSTKHTTGSSTSATATNTASTRTEYSIVGNTVYLPLPRQVSNVTVEEAILWRRSLREYKDEPLTLTQLSMILWAAQGITDPARRFRAAPSAGATYPLVLYVVVGDRGVLLEPGKYLRAGVYRYDVMKHALTLVRDGDLRGELAKASLNQPWVRDAPVDLVLCAVFERTTRVYGERGIRYVYMEAGHAAQNVYLMATALGLGTVVVGAFHDDWVASVVEASKDEAPLYVIPVGVPKGVKHPSFQEIDNWYSSQRGEG